MYQLYYWPTPNGHKVTMFLEEAGLPYELIAVDIGKGDQFKPDFLKISPNNRMPALIDKETGISTFESGAILLYLAEKHELFLPKDAGGRADTLKWLFWQMSGLGPMLGQANHFLSYATEKIPYAMERYENEGRRLLGVLDKLLANRTYVAGDSYTIADMACYPWALAGTYVISKLDMPNLEAWIERVKERPATVRAYAIAEEPRFERKPMDDEQRKILFGQGKPAS